MTDADLIPMRFDAVRRGSEFKERRGGVWHLKMSNRHGMYQQWGTRYEPPFFDHETVYVKEQATMTDSIGIYPTVNAVPRDLPILYSGPMVRAILAKMKRMTRRLSGLEIVNLDPDAWELRDVDNLGTALFSLKGRVGDSVKGKPGHRWTTDRMACKSRHGGVGDSHWIRETYCLAHSESTYIDDGRPKRADGRWCFYAATEPDVEPSEECEQKSPWRPSIHMPRWASRISTRVTGVKVERLQDIPWWDIKAEGVACPEHDGPGMMCCSECASLRAAFVKLWDGINPDMPYAFNPWVRCTSFELIEGPHA